MPRGGVWGIFVFLVSKWCFYACFENMFFSKKGTLIKRAGVRTPWTPPVSALVTWASLVASGSPDCTRDTRRLSATSDGLCLLVEVHQPCVHVSFSFLGHTLATDGLAVEHVVSFGICRTQITAHDQSNTTPCPLADYWLLTCNHHCNSPRLGGHTCVPPTVERDRRPVEWPINPPTTVLLSFTFILPPPERCKLSQQVWNRVMNWTWTCVSPYCDLLD